MTHSGKSGKAASASGGQRGYRFRRREASGCIPAPLCQIVGVLLPHLVIGTVDGDVVPYQPTQMDLLARDWERL